VVRVAEQALHVPLLLVHAVFIMQKSIGTMALDAVGDGFRRLPFGGLPAALEVLVQIVRHRVDDLSRHLGAALIFLLGGDLLAGDQGPFGNRGVTERGHGLGLDLLGELGDVVEPFSREFHARVPPHHPVDDGRVAVSLVIGYQVDDIGADTQSSAKRAVSGVPIPGVREHVFREGGPGITYFLFQEAGVPQPSAVASAASG
jgi:hypothetical protein